MMTAAISEARATLKTAVEAKIVELMATTVDRLKSELADAVLTECDNPLNEFELTDQIVHELAGCDFEDTLRLVAVEVPATA